MDYKKLKKKIAKHYGSQQLDILQEECAELIQAVSKYKRYGNVENLKEEIADVQIMIDQARIIIDFEIADFLKAQGDKLKRQIERIEGEVK